MSNSPLQSERGAVFAEYAIAVGILLTVFAVGGALLFTQAMKRGNASAAVTSHTMPFDAADDGNGLQGEERY